MIHPLANVELKAPCGPGRVARVVLRGGSPLRDGD
jgi:hypothetical protein